MPANTVPGDLKTRFPILSDITDWKSWMKLKDATPPDDWECLLQNLEKIIPSPNWTEWENRWEGPIVPRTKIGPFSGHSYSSRHFANIDSAGQGPPLFYINSKACYELKPLIGWLRERFLFKHLKFRQPSPKSRKH